jgi:hypothetical protein
LDEGGNAEAILEDLVLCAMELLQIPVVAAAVDLAEALLLLDELSGEEVDLMYSLAVKASEEAMEAHHAFLAKARAQLTALEARLDQMGARLRDIKLKRGGK